MRGNDYIRDKSKKRRIMRVDTITKRGQVKNEHWQGVRGMHTKGAT